MSAIDIFTKIILPTLTILLAAIGHKEKWGLRTDHLFERYSKLSKFTFELGNQLGEQRLKEIAGEYGYAAIIREKGLTRDERYTLLNMLNPVEGIEDYHTCSNYLKINVVDRTFIWKRQRYNNTLYKNIVSITTSTIYFIGAAMLFSPIFYQPFRDSIIGDIFRKLTTNAQIGITIYLTLSGLFLVIISLNKMSRLYKAGELIKKSSIVH
ncbi:hypothetical protein [Serratia sp. 201]|uniref:hypothetical protein n=1 Tax=Serratia sp. 201 TaxID=3096764 RepID=UPI00300883ED